MFEDSTFESTGRIHTRSRLWSIATLALNTSILAALIVIPLVFPEALPRHLTEILLSAPPTPPAVTKPQEPKPVQTFHGTAQLTPLGLTVPTQIPTSIRMVDREAPPAGDQIAGWDNGPAIPGSNPFSDSAARRPHVTSAAPTGPERITSRLAEGMLLDRVMPIYPPIARAAGVQGTVVLEATISKGGSIENLRVLSGPQMLQQAAIDAVSRWRYRPYLLNGGPVEVETTVSVVFSLGR